jgi:SecD/SecF fusion protein
MGLIVAGLIAVGLLAIPGSPIHDEPTLGLDLQGGLEVTLQAVPPEQGTLEEADLDRSVEILRDRVDRLGVAEPEIRTQGDDQIVIDLPGVKNPDRVIDILGQTAQLELFDLEANLAPPSRDASGFAAPKESLYDLLAGQQALVDEDAKTTWYLFDEDRKLRAGPTRERAGLLQTEVVEEANQEEDGAAAGGGSGGSSGDPAEPPSGNSDGSGSGELPEGWRIFGVPPKTVVVTCGVGEVVCPGVGIENPQQNFYYLFKYDPTNADPSKRVPEMTGALLELDGTRQDFDTTTGEPIVTMQFTDEGGDRFLEITNREADRGRAQYNIRGAGGDPRQFFQHFAIVLDRQIKSWPSIDFEQYPNGIGGSNGAQITGIGDLQEAQDLALVLQSGALPVTFTTLESTTISATLGADSLEQAWQAAIAGLLVVALFLLVFYRFLGLVAVFGLGIYAAFTYAIILLFDVTLTLPGFAGLILSIGVAADANIVIFERIKEESRAGKSVRAAIANGYKKGFATIVDANVVTALAAMVLFAVATAGVKGFAFMLLLGTGISIITAVLATRAMLGLLGGFGWFDNPVFMGAKARKIPWWQRIDIVGRRRIWFAIAGVLIVLSLGSIVFKGLNLGIDFEGGTSLSFSTPQPQQLADVRETAAEIGQEDSTILGRGVQAADGGYSEFSFRSEPLEPSEQAVLTNTLEREFDADVGGGRNVSASFSEQILRGAILALFVSFLLITIYISFRFEWRFAVPILRAIVNDGLIALGVYSISDREVSAATVAAFLTIIGFSIYDTIIIFDRVRENIPLMRRSSIARIINVSLWETIPRSLATTFIVLLPVSALFFFGGETLKDFAFALLVGISVSAFSTIFIAAPFLAVLKEREPEFARRKSADAVAEESVGGLREAEALAAAQPAPELIPEELMPATLVDGDGDGAATSDAAKSKRERRRQRRASRPHGRAR